MPEASALAMIGLDLRNQPVFRGEDLDQLSVYARPGKHAVFLYMVRGQHFSQFIAADFFCLRVHAEGRTDLRREAKPAFRGVPENPDGIASSFEFRREGASPQVTTSVKVRGGTSEQRAGVMHEGQHEASFRSKDKGLTDSGAGNDFGGRPAKVFVGLTGFVDETWRADDDVGVGVLSEVDQME